MNWASREISALQRGETVQFRPRGHSMLPRIRSGELCTVEPVKEPKDVKVGDVVLCRVYSHDYLHIVRRIAPGPYGLQFLIGNARGKENGWTTRVFGKLVKVEP